MATELSLDTIIKIAGVGGVAAAVVNQALKTVVDAATSYIGKRAEAAYAAVRSVVMLERYVQQSEAHITASEIAFDRRESMRSLPAPDPLPSDINWKTFDTTLSFKVLSFASDVQIAQASCDLTEREIGIWDGMAEARQLGLAAWALAVNIRKRYGLGRNYELEDLIPLLSDREMERARRRGQWMAERAAKSDGRPQASNSEI